MAVPRAHRRQNDEGYVLNDNGVVDATDVRVAKRPQHRQGLWRGGSGRLVGSCVQLAWVGLVLLDGVYAGDTRHVPPSAEHAASSTAASISTSSSSTSHARLGTGASTGDVVVEQVDTELQFAKQGSYRGRTLMMYSTPMMVGGLGDGVVGLLACYIVLFLSVGVAVITPFACTHLPCAAIGFGFVSWDHGRSCTHPIADYY
jgi:hypothetical protein